VHRADVHLRQASDLANLVGDNREHAINVTAEPLDERGPLFGSTDQVAADLDQATKLGIEHVYWNSDDDPLNQLPLLEQLRRG
jgi:hypothetical protein